jgi:predicted nucleotidyltransferase component of viral defense system
MLSLKKIKEFYPENLRSFERHILREYLQYKALEIIYNSKSGEKLVFLGGTALRIIHENQRFSEDLDFDNLGVDINGFQELSDSVKEKLEKEGLGVEIKTTFKDSFRCYIKFTDILFKEEVSRHKDEKLTIQIDSFPQEYAFSPELFTLDNFDVYTKIKTTPVETILSQKIYCILNRKRMMGRDFFDVSFLINNKKIKPDFAYLKQKTGISNKKELFYELKKGLQGVDFEKIADDVSFLLIDQNHKKRVEKFYEDVIEKTLREINND